MNVNKLPVRVHEFKIDLTDDELDNLFHESGWIAEHLDTPYANELLKKLTKGLV